MTTTTTTTRRRSPRARPGLYVAADTARDAMPTDRPFRVPRTPLSIAFAPLHAWWKVRHAAICPPDASNHMPDAVGSLAALARETGIDARQVQRWATAGRLTIDSADDVAVRLGVHPFNIWHDAWWQDVLDDVAAGKPDAGDDGHRLDELPERKARAA